MVRESGFYWVKHKNNWIIAFYDKFFEEWDYPNISGVSDMFWDEIDNNEVLRNSELSSKNLQLQDQNKELRRVREKYEKQIQELKDNNSQQGTTILEVSRALFNTVKETEDMAKFISNLIK